MTPALARCGDPNRPMDASVYAANTMRPDGLNLKGLMSLIPIDAPCFSLGHLMHCA
jgi:hypothetical protein